jgi:hypothetical protein
MKKEVSMTIFLLLGLSFRSFAGTGNVNDGLEFLLVIIGLLITLLSILSGVDYLRKNRKTMFYNAMSFLDKMISFLRNYINKVKSDYFDLSYF